jgi:protein-tyrosine kinase
MGGNVSKHELDARETLERTTPGSGWLAEAQCRDRDFAIDVRERFSHRRLGEIMVMMDLLSRNDIDEVLERQEELGLPFGECCLRLKLINESDLSQALAWQFGYVHPVSRSLTFAKDLVMVTDPFGPYAEALRSISGRLVSRWIGAGRNVLPITSAEPEDGRSHVAANLAVSFAQARLRTLLVDADLRKSRQHVIFDAPQHPGLSRLLCGFAPKDVVRHFPSLKYLALIPSGPIPPNPLELLGRNELTTFMEQAGEYYDVVVVDTPAGEVFADAELIASAAGSALIIARRNQTHQRKVQNLASRLTDNGVQIAGTIMNVY